MDDYCQITFTGDHGGTYYVACDQVQNISSRMFNTGNSSINLYKNIRQGINQEYISIAALSYPVYHPASGSNTSYITNASVTGFNDRGYYFREYQILDLSLTVTLTILLLINVFLRRH